MIEALPQPATRRENTTTAPSTAPT
jgi:hypothetical protein